MAADASRTITAHLAPGVRLRPRIPGFQPESVGASVLAVPQSKVARQPGESLPEGSPKETFRTVRPGPSACGADCPEHCELGSFVTCAKHRSMWNTCQVSLTIQQTAPRNKVRGRTYWRLVGPS